MNPHLVEGVYTEALTSSPGLAASLESSVNPELVTIGHSVAYPVGVVIIIFFIQFVQIVTKMDLEGEKKLFRKSVGKGDAADDSSVMFNLSGFCLAALAKVLWGIVPILLGSLGSVALGNA